MGQDVFIGGSGLEVQRLALGEDEIVGLFQRSQHGGVEVFHFQLPQLANARPVPLFAGHVGQVDHLVQLRHPGPACRVAGDGGKDGLILHAPLGAGEDGRTDAVPDGGRPLFPTLGVVYVTEGTSFVMADIPGIIEGASDGAGLGHDFLRHIDRCRLLVHLVDVSGSEGRDPVEDFEAINAELRAYSDVLGSRMQIVAANKCDLLGDDRTNIDRLRAHVEAQGYAFFEMSAAAHTGTRELVQACAAKLAEIPPMQPYEADYVPPEPEVGTSDELQIRHFDDLWVVEGPWLQRLMGSINFGDYESRMYFDRVLRQSGLFDRLEAMGIEEGDTVSIYDLDFEFRF